MKPSVATMGAFVVMILVVFGSSSEATISCSDVMQDMRPCVSYLTSSSGSEKPPAECCSGAKQLVCSASTSDDKQTACNFLKSAAKKYSSINTELAQDLPANCGINITISFSSDVDCSK